MALLLLISFLVLVALSLQYPLSTTFPIGGDAAHYARQAQIILQFFDHPANSIQALKTSWYPLSLLMFSATAIFPADWPVRFIWSMVTAHIAVGLCLSLLLRRLGGWPAAAFTMFIWGITTTGINSNFEDGTLAQLISFFWLALFLERFTAGARISTLLALVATVFSHPITGLFLLSTLIFASPALFSAWPVLPSSHKKQLLLLIPSSLILLLLVLFTGKQVFSSSNNIAGVAHDPFINVLVSGFSPFVALAPFGLLWLLKSRHSSNVKILLAFFFSLSTILAGNDLLEISVWTQRLLPLFILAVSILTSLALPRLLATVFPGHILRLFFALLIIAYFTAATGTNNYRVFRHYENSDNYARLHPEELSAMQWIRANLPANSYIITSSKNRHTEWLPVITFLPWFALSPDDASLSHPTSDKIDSAMYSRTKYVAFLTRRENIPDNILMSPDRYPLIYANKSFALFRVPSAYD